MDLLKTFLAFSKKEQYAIVFLLALLLLLSATAMLADRLIQPPVKAISGLNDSITFAAQYLSDKENKTKESPLYDSNTDKSDNSLNLKPFPFNPNNLPEDTWAKLGLMDYQIRNILNYERSGGKFVRKEDLAKLYTITKEEYAILEPYIVIPIAEEKTTTVYDQSDFSKKTEEAEITATPIQPINLNQADSLDLIRIPNIGPWFAHRIIKYRNILGGYSQFNQLLEVHGMDSNRYVQIKPYLLLDPILVSKIKINHLEFKELLRHPYLNFEQVKAIMNHRNRRGFIQTDEELIEITGIHPEEFASLKPYLDYQ